MRRTKEDAQQTRESLLDAAECLFAERGVSRTSLQDIAKAAGVTRGAVYRMLLRSLPTALSTAALRRSVLVLGV